MSVRTDLRELFVVRSAPGRWTVALQAAIAMAIPLVGFAIAGRPDLGLLASIGAFTALHFANRSRRQRITLLPLVAAGLVAASAVGVAASGSAPLAAIAVWAVAIVASVIILGFGAGPPGSMFFVLVAGVSTHLAADGIDGGLLIGMIALGSLTSYLVVLAPLLVPRVRLNETHVAIRGFEFDAITRVIFIRLVIGVTAAILIAVPLAVPRSYWVIVAVVVILQNGHQLRLTAFRAVHRVVGTIIGVGLFALIGLWNPSGLALALLLVALQFVVESFIVRNYGLALIFITPLALTIAAQGEPTTAVIIDRIVDTLLGAAIALLVLAGSWLLRKVRPARTS